MIAKLAGQGRIVLFRLPLRRDELSSVAPLMKSIRNNLTQIAVMDENY